MYIQEKVLEKIRQTKQGSERRTAHEVFLEFQLAFHSLPTPSTPELEYQWSCNNMTGMAPI